MALRDLDIRILRIYRIPFFLLDIIQRFNPFNRRCRIYPGLYFLLAHQVPHFNMLEIKCDINQQDLKRVHFHFVKSE